MSVGRPRGLNGNRPVFVYDSVKKDKRYVGHVGPCTGSNRPRTCGCAACKEARKLEAAESKPRETTGLRVDEWAALWLDEMHGEGTTRPEDTTYRHNKDRVGTFLKEFGSRRLDSITVEDAERFALKYPSRAKSVKAMFADAERRRRITVDPFRSIKVAKGKGRSEITPLTEQEVARLAEIARTHHPMYGNEFAALITFAGWTGLRPGELCGLEWTEVDLRTNAVFVEWQTRNDGSRHRVKRKINRRVPLTAPALEALKGLPSRPGAVFRSPTGKPLRPNMLRHYWKPVRNAFTAELPMDHWLPRRLRHDPRDFLDPYELRHAFGSLLADRGLSARDISEVMGNSPQVCESVYVHPYASRVQERVRTALEGAAGNLRVVDVGSDSEASAS